MESENENEGTASVALDDPICSLPIDYETGKTWKAPDEWGQCPACDEWTPPGEAIPTGSDQSPGCIHCDPEKDGIPQLDFPPIGNEVKCSWCCCDNPPGSLYCETCDTLIDLF
jgi:hypothetical protein